MPHKDDIQAREQETGFGTGLRRQLERRRGDHELHDVEPPELVEALATEEEHEPADDGQRTEADELRLELEAALSREARLRTALAEQSQARERAEDLARELDRALAEVAELKEARAEVSNDVTPRRFLREQVERHVDALWQVFEQALEAVRPDGTPDFATRLDAARTLLAEAYDVPDENGELPAVQTARDELAGRRARRAHQQPLL